MRLNYLLYQAQLKSKTIHCKRHLKKVTILAEADFVLVLNISLAFVHQDTVTIRELGDTRSLM